MLPGNTQAAHDASEQPFGGPFADIHRHGESNAWLDRLLAVHDGRPPYDWAAWRQRLPNVPPGPARIAAFNQVMDTDRRNELLDESEWVAPVLEACLRAAAESGVMLTEVRIGYKSATMPGFLEHFREAESAVREQCPRFCAEPLLAGAWPGREDALESFEACLAAGPRGFAGVDIVGLPYEERVDWDEAHRWAARFAEAGFGITVHAGEFTANHLAPALETPGVSRIGHGVALAREPQLLNQAIDRGIVVECCPTANLLLGAVATLKEHPIREFVDRGVKVAICTDNPARLGTTIREEYAIAAGLGLSAAQLTACTRVAVEASFTPPGKKQAILGDLAGYGES